MSNFKVLKGAPGLVKTWTNGLEIESTAEAQLRNMSGLPFIHKHIAVMPDVHAGRGATIGSVIPTVGAVVPAAVGVDLGCGMMAVRTSLTASDLPDNLQKVRSRIERMIPHGRTDHGGRNDRGAWGDIPDDVAKAWNNQLKSGFKKLVERNPLFEKSNNIRHLSSLGQGNHFLEVCLDEEGRVWCMLHSGSRGIGNRIGSYFISLAKKEMERWFIHLPDKDLAYFPEGFAYFNDYVASVSWAQKFAKVNRELLMNRIVDSLRHTLRRNFLVDKKAINCHHNYVDRENHFGKNVWVTRKGAVRARKNDLGIIPGAMGRSSFIVKGKGNKESFCSCSHGAGRTMSRSRAKKIFTIDDHIRETAGLECRKDVGVLDETPLAYKNIFDVMKAQEDLVEVLHTLKSVVCIKG